MSQSQYASHTHYPTIQCSIREYLQHPNPMLELRPRKSTQSERTSRVQSQLPSISDNILPWNSFNLAYIETRFGKILDTVTKFPPFPVLQPSQLMLANEPSFESVLIAYNNNIVNNALKATNLDVVFLPGSYFYLKEQKPDWGGGPVKGGHLNNHLPGETKYISEPLEIPFTAGLSEPQTQPNEEFPNPQPAIHFHSGDVGTDCDPIIDEEDFEEELELPKHQTASNRYVTPKGSVHPQSQHKRILSDQTPLPIIVKKAKQNHHDHNTSTPIPSAPIPSDHTDDEHERGKDHNFRVLTEQVINYAAALKTRYCYMITPVEVLAIRCFSDPKAVGDSNMKTRSSVAQPQDQHPSPDAPSSQLREFDVNASFGASSQSDWTPDFETNEPEAVLAGIQIGSFSWRNPTGSWTNTEYLESEEVGTMSYNMALWALHLMALDGHQFDTLAEYAEEDAKFM